MFGEDFGSSKKQPYHGIVVDGWRSPTPLELHPHFLGKITASETEKTTHPRSSRFGILPCLSLLHTTKTVAGNPENKIELLKMLWFFAI